MCGITGLYAFNEIGRFYLMNLVPATKALSSRGPDQQGTFLQDHVGLGHRRLSIIDLTTDGKQPMTDPTNRYVIVFNGEIFNFKILRNQLQEQGVAFRSQSDTEVLLQLYIREGKDCLQKLNGFFAFAIFDKQSGELFIARDRMGIKPLHVYQDDDKLIFGSELKTLTAYNIPREIDYASLSLYLQLNYIPPPYSIYKNVRKLMPGHYLHINGRQITEEPYYRIPYQPDTIAKDARSYEELQQQLVSLLEQSVERRLVSDVPLGAFLSGGIDSSVIVALASRHTEKLNTYSIGFKDNPFFDETHYAQQVAEKYQTNHTVFSLTNDDLLTHYQSVLDYLDEPFADSSALAVNILSRETRKHVTVALSGDGADELFGGYNKYLGEYKVRTGGIAVQAVSALLPVWKMLPSSRNSAWSNKVRQLERFAEGARMNARDRYWRWASFNDKTTVLRLLHADKRYVEEEMNRRMAVLTTPLGKGRDLNDVLYNDAHMVLAGDMLPKVDFMSMKNSLEVRVPFLDHTVVEFAFSLSSKYKVGQGMKKRIVQDAFRSLLPESLYNRPKQGFDVPLKQWFKTELRREIEQLLHDDFLQQQGVFDPAEMRKMKENVLKGGNYDQEAFWNILCLQYWWRATQPIG